jgi:Ca2+-binding EF-hand superfamily protein
VRKRIASLFQFMDLDGSGGVSRDELRASLQCLGWRNVSWDEVDNLMTETAVGEGIGGGVGERLHYEDLVEVIENAIIENEKEED